MHFAFLPPEVNSGRMYAGPGSGSLLAAATGWDSLAAELDVTAQAYESILTSLTGLHWHGPAAAAMLAAAVPYVAWLRTTAEQTSQTAMQARAAAAAYELAYTTTIPPAVVAANRGLLAALVATNFFGQNTAAIAATEALYAEFWAQDAAAMSSYAASSAAASRLTPFPSPQRTADAAAPSPPAQGIPISGSDPSLRSLFTALDPSSLFNLDLSVFNVVRVIGTTINSSFKIEAIDTGIIGSEHAFGLVPQLAGTTGEVSPAAPQSYSLAARLGGGPGLGEVAAGLSRAGRIGSMSVPASWASDHAVVAPPSALTGGGPAGGWGPGNPAGPGALSGIPGTPGARGGRPGIVVPRYGLRIIAVMSRPPAAG